MSSITPAWRMPYGCFPRRPFFMLSEIEFVKECRRIAEEGKDAVRSRTALLEPLLEGKDGPDIVRTLSVFLLDTNRSVTQTAEQLFVHKNTVKFRLQKAGDLLGFHVGDAAQANGLICALSLLRMLRSDRAD